MASYYRLAPGSYYQLAPDSRRPTRTLTLTHHTRHRYRCLDASGPHTTREPTHLQVGSFTLPRPRLIPLVGLPNGALEL
jgi:hypothetical protein